MASSDDEHELADILNSHRPEGSQDSDLPAWIQAHTPVKVQIDISDDSDQATAPDRTAADDASGPKAAAAAGSSKAGAGSSKAAAAAGTSSKPGANLKAAGELVPAVAVLSSAVGEVASGEIPVILPEKLIRHKVLVELEPAPHQATELSGDAGAVARIIASAEAAADGCFKLDLKGMLYQATVLPLAGTALVANIGPTEAKIEAVMSDFVRLREESSYLEGGMLLEGGNGMTDWMADDEDNYQLDEDGKEAGAGKQAGKKAGAAAKRKPGAKPGAGKALKLTGGVKKKPASKKAGGKGSKTPSKAKQPKAKQPKAARSKGKAAGAKGAGAGGKSGAAAGAKGKPAAPKKKKQDSESEADFETDSDGGGGNDSDWSMD